MSIFSTMLEQWHVSLGVFFLLSSLAILVVGKQQRAAVLDKLYIRRRRASGASTPPRSFSPDKKTGGTQGSSLPTSSTDFVNAFPPSRRLVLPELAKTTSPENAKILLATNPDAETLVKEALPTTRAYDLQNASPKYTPTGFSTAEIKAMGDFPAYDVLSGVPLPAVSQRLGGISPILDISRAMSKDPWTKLPSPNRTTSGNADLEILMFSHMQILIQQKPSRDLTDPLDGPTTRQCVSQLETSCYRLLTHE